MSFTTHVVMVADDLPAICEQMQPDLWTGYNHMTNYKPARLKQFLESGEILLFAQNGDNIADVVIARKLLHPAGEGSLYVHGLDTHPDYRCQGVGTVLISECKEIAKAEGLTEVWLGTESNNDAANAFYKTPDPYEIHPSVIYAYKVQ